MLSQNIFSSLLSLGILYLQRRTLPQTQIARVSLTKRFPSVHSRLLSQQKCPLLFQDCVFPELSVLYDLGQSLFLWWGSLLLSEFQLFPWALGRLSTRLQRAPLPQTSSSCKSLR